MNQENYVYFAGEWKRGEGTRRTLKDPANEKPLFFVKESSKEQVNLAVQSAQEAFAAQKWSKDVKMRVNTLKQLANLLEEKGERFARIEARNVGKPIREARLDIADSVACLRYYADYILKLGHVEKNMSDGTISTISQEPIGVCALIVPWNFPLLLGIWKIAPALAAGNTIVFKPSELTPLSMIEFTKLIDEAKVPSGVFNLVLGNGDPVGKALVEHPNVSKVSFTGGSETGRQIYQSCAASLKRVSLELGGKNPLIVLDDVDLEIAAEWVLFGSFFNQGEVCVASSRILVPENLKDDLVQSLTDKLNQLKIGDPLNELTDLGPLISKEHFEKVVSYIEIGKQEGAKLIFGGNQLKDKGYYLMPAIFTEVEQNMKIVQEEIFGPVITIQTYKTVEQAIVLANDSDYGLAAGVLSNHVANAEQVAVELSAGTVWVNSYHTPYVDAPWGGFKKSGIGRELGPQGYESFTETKHLNVSKSLDTPGWYQF